MPMQPRKSLCSFKVTKVAVSILSFGVSSYLEKSKSSRFPATHQLKESSAIAKRVFCSCSLNSGDHLPLLCSLIFVSFFKVVFSFQFSVFSK